MNQDEIDDQVFELYDEYCHGNMDRRDFFRVAAAGSLLMGSGGFRWPANSLGVAEAAGAWIRSTGRAVG